MSAAPEQSIAIVGLAGRFPGADSVEALWENLCAGREGITFFDKADIDPSVPTELVNNANYVAAKGIIADIDKFDAEFFGISPLESKIMDPQQRLLLELSWAALEDAGLAARVSKLKVGVWVGTNWNRYFETNVQTNASVLDRFGEFNARIANAVDFPAARISYKLGLTGPSITLATACSTSLVAIAQAVQSLNNYECDVAIAGGASISVPNAMGYLYQEGSMLAKDGHCRPFDNRASGTTFNDGVGVVVLRRAEDAVDESADIYALIRGVGVNNDGADKVSFTAPSVRGQAGAIEAALANADVDPDSIGYIEAHGTATPMGDPIEIEALRRAYASNLTVPLRCALGSVKSNVGHLVHAAGVLGLIKAALAVKTGKIPPTLFFETPNPKLRLDETRFFVNSDLIEWPIDGVRRAGVSSFGVGGTNAHAIVEQPPRMPASDPTTEIGLLPISAKHPQSLELACGQLASYVRSTRATLGDVSFTLATSRHAFDHRIVVAAETLNGAADSLATRKGTNVTRGVAKPFVRTAFAFPGQGAQKAGMAASLYAGSAVARSVIDECLELMGPYLDTDLRALVLAESATESMQRTIAQTKYAQPALFLVEYALARYATSLGLRPDALIGHSIGEFAAACIASVLSLEDAIRVVCTRGRLMQSMQAGSMLSLSVGENDAADWLRQGISIAAVNAPDSVVLSGDSESIANLMAELDQRGQRHRRLDTSHAFHSWMMEPMLEEFRAVVAGVPLNAPTIPIVSTSTGTWLSDAQATSPDYWCSQVRNAVQFAGAVRTLTADGRTAMVELGPGSTLTSLALRQIDSAHVVVAAQSHPSLSSHLACQLAIGELWTKGAEVDWASAFAAERRSLVRLPTYAFRRERHWLDAGASPAQAIKGAAAAPSSQPSIEAVRADVCPVDSGPKAPWSKESVQQKVIALFEDASGLELDVTDSTSFTEAGLDSLFLTQAAKILHAEFAVEISFRELVESRNTFGALAAHIAAIAPPPVDADVEIAAVPDAAKGRSSAEDGIDAPASMLKARHDEPDRRDDQRPKSVRAWSDLNAIQSNALRGFIDSYAKRTGQSKAHVAKYRKHHADPRTAAGSHPVWKEMVYPIVCSRSDGARLWDLDGNEYIDLLNGFGPNFLGHRHPSVVAAISEQLQRGFEIGPQTPLAGEVAELVCELTGMDRASLVCTGSEAVQAAIRCARTYTQRDTIVVFRGAYHGNFDEVLVRGGVTRGKLRSHPSAPGIPDSAVENVVVLDYADPGALEVIAAIGDQLAAVMVEPVQSRKPELQPAEFLRELRRATEDVGALLIFDEVVTGFRCHPGGAQALFAVRADLVTYGKVAGGNMPIGIVAGRGPVMDIFDGGAWQYGDDSMPESGVTFFAGTFVRHPLSVAACHAVLTYLKQEGPALQQRLTRMTDDFAVRIAQLFDEFDAPFEMPHFASVLYLRNRDSSELGALLWYFLRHNGVYIQDGFPSYLTLAHGPQEIDAVVDVFRRSLAQMREAGFLPTARPRVRPIERAPIIAAAPPVPGARLGKDPQGNPAWFVPDPDEPRRFRRVL